MCSSAFVLPPLPLHRTRLKCDTKAFSFGQISLICITLECNITSTHFCVGMRACMYVCMHVCVCLCAWACVRARVCVCVCVYACVRA